MSKFKLLTRDQFRDQVLARGQNKCELCGAPAHTAHHIMERRLWPDGGYYVENGAAVCDPCHIKCEQTVVSVEDVRLAAGIDRAPIPPHLYDDIVYDKWGNPIMPNGTRAKGELFFDESVQKILKDGNVLDLFTNRVKYPRTHHLPWSGNINSDDRVIDSLDGIVGRRGIVTVKMDGENTTMMRDHFHARSLDSRNHPSRNWVKRIWGELAHDIPTDWRICGENLYAKHSIEYNDLESYFMGFSVWNEKNVSLAWDDTLEWFKLLSIQPVPVIYDGIITEQILRDIARDVQTDVCEGFVVRVADAITYRNFKHEVAKWVRPNHVQTVKHWMMGQPIVPNKLKGAK